MVLRSQSHNFCKAIKEGFKEANEFARKNVGAATQRYKEYSDAQGARIHSRSVTGSEACAPYVKRGLTRKLAQPWHGMHFIVKDLSAIVYRIKKENSVLGHQWRGNCSTYCSILSGVQGLCPTFICQETARVGQTLLNLFRNLKALV